MSTEYPNYQNIYLFCSIIKLYNPRNYNTFRELFNIEMRGFTNTFDFFKDIKLIDIKNDKLIVDPGLKKNLSLLQGQQSYNIPHKFFLANCIINNSNSNIYAEIIDLLSTFRLDKSKLRLELSKGRSVKTRKLISLLVELNFLEVKQKYYYVSDEISSISEYIKNRRGISQQNLNAILNYKSTLGELAEKQIMQYEIDRLSLLGFTRCDISIVGRKNVNCGYDILSYTLDKDELTNIFIEVKAVSKKDYKFFWTKNEKQAARYLDNKYYLYLLPVIKGNRFDLTSLKIIQDPISYFKKNTDWKIVTELESYTSA